jgi:hypothetical protein
MRRVTDQTCSGHARLRDRFARRALLLDLLILGLGSWLIALAFVDPAIATRLTPIGISPIIWIGVLGVANFFLGIVQLRVDWKARSEAHGHAMQLHADLKRELNIALSRDPADVSDAEHARITTQAAMIAIAAVAIPDADFLALKRHHKLKVAVSVHLDNRPGALVWLTKLKFLLRDNSLR